MPTPPVVWNSSTDTITARTSSTSSSIAAIVAQATASGGYARGLEAFTDRGHAVRGEAAGSGGLGVYGISHDTLGSGIGVYGESKGATGYGIRAYQSGERGYGVYARQSGSQGCAVYGYATSSLSTSSLWAAGVYGLARARHSVGVYGQHSATQGIAVRGEHTGSDGYGVYGTAGDQGQGVYGRASGTLSCYGIDGWGTTVDDWAIGVRGYGRSTNGRAYGVHGTASSTAGQAVGVEGWAFATPGHKSSAFAGVHGKVESTYGYGVYSQGDFGGTGSKYFIQPHPTDASKTVQFICLEGNESGTYFRGKARLVNGRADIDIPQEWKEVTAGDGVTVQVSAIGVPAGLYIAEQSRDRIVIRGQKDCAFNYFVNGVRRGFAEYEPYIPNTAFRPDVKGVPFGAQYPKALRDILVSNGVLNPDYTPNEATAARLGWKLKEQSDVPPEHRWWLPAAERERLMHGDVARPVDRSEAPDLRAPGESR